MNHLLPVAFTPDARRQAEGAAEWWVANRPKAQQAFAEEIERAIALIASQPAIGAVARNVRLRGVRRVLLHRVRYHLYYRIVHKPEPMVEVIAVWHSARQSGAPL